MATGIVKWFNSSKGYGFISPSEEDEEVFVRELTIALENQIQAARYWPDIALTEVSQVLEYYSWPAVFARVERTYQAVKGC